MLIAHGAIGYLSNKLLQKKKLKKLDTAQYLFVVITAIFFGILPDFDIFILLAISKPTFLHHQIVTHTPFFWVIVFILLNITYSLIYKHLNKKLQEFLNPEFTKILLYTILIATLSHLFTDLTTGYIQLLYPFTPYGFTLMLFPVNVFAGARLHPAFAVELLIITIFGIHIVKEYLKANKILLRILKYVLVPITLIFLIFATAIQFYVVSVDNITLSDKHIPIYDQDYDGISDSKDSDVDNDGINNLEEVDRKELMEALERIGYSRNYVVSFNKEQRSLKEKIFYIFGAQDSYRLVQEAYIRINKPINPVIDNDKSYNSDLDSPRTLYEYLKNRNELIDVTENHNELNSAKIIFFLKDNVITNIGITLNNNGLITSIGFNNTRVWGLDTVLEHTPTDSIQIQK